jgi:cobalamin biosynthesis Mg chelatase CobN
MDVATALRLKELDNLHIVIRDEVGHLERLHDQKFVKVDATFLERDKLASRESDLNKVALDAAFKAQQEAVAAALKAQQEAAARQDEANQKAIDKSEAATEKTITTNQELAQSRLDALTKALDETKVRITVIEAVKSGNVEQKSEGRQSTAALVAIAGFAIMSILFLITIVGFIMEISKNASGS